MIWLMILLCVIWGFNWIVMKSAVDYFPPVMFSVLRFTLGSLILLAICYYKKVPLPKKGDWKWYAICGLLQTAYVFTINQQALLYLDAGLTSLIGFTMPFWFAILAHFFVGERLNSVKVTALVMGITGLFFVLEVNPLQFEWTGITLLAQLLVLSGSVAWAVSNIIVKKVLQKNDKLQFTTYQMLIGSAALFIYSLLFERGQTITWSMNSILLILFAGAVASAFAFVLWFYLLERGEGGKASLSLLLVPMIGIICGWLFLGETIHLVSIIGMVLIISGIGLVNVKQENKLLSTLKIKKKAV
ncbi:DMT family transporter [bacterium LRH843]|nr:DMT family transporter [bacterium LRH843]